MIRPFLSTLLLINGSIALAFGIFYALVKLCLYFSVSPYWAGVVYVAAYVAWWRNARKEACHVEA